MLHFEQELAVLKNNLLTMASHAETAVKEAVRALEALTCHLHLRLVFRRTQLAKHERCGFTGS